MQLGTFACIPQHIIIAGLGQYRHTVCVFCSALHCSLFVLLLFYSFSAPFCSVLFCSAMLCRDLCSALLWSPLCPTKLSALLGSALPHSVLLFFCCFLLISICSVGTCSSLLCSPLRPAVLSVLLRPKLFCCPSGLFFCSVLFCCPHCPVVHSAVCCFSLPYVGLCSA